MIHVLEVVVSSAVCTWGSCWRKLLTRVLPPLTNAFLHLHSSLCVGTIVCVSAGFNH